MVVVTIVVVFMGVQKKGVLWRHPLVELSAYKNVHLESFHCITEHNLDTDIKCSFLVKKYLRTAMQPGLAA